MIDGMTEHLRGITVVVLDVTGPPLDQGHHLVFVIFTTS